MGVYDELAHLPETPPVASPKPVQTAVPAGDDGTPHPAQRRAIQRRTSAAPTARPNAIPTLTIDPRSSRHRIITRASFEIYQDQIHVLRQVSLSAKLEGDNLSISEMAREAFDNYLTAKNLKP